MTESKCSEMVSHLRRCGKRITPERELLLRIIEEHAHLGAEEIHRIAQADRPQIGLATVYRTLTLLKEMGIIQATDLGENHDHYELHSEDHLHLVCSTCGRVTDIPVPLSLHKAAAGQGFSIQRTSLEVFGVCGACAKKAARSARRKDT
jgi:Fe2+ or Zn2+ uptake regulation protein